MSANTHYGNRFSGAKNEKVSESLSLEESDQCEELILLFLERLAASNLSGGQTTYWLHSRVKKLAPDKSVDDQRRITSALVFRIASRRLARLTESSAYEILPDGLVRIGRELAATMPPSHEHLNVSLNDPVVKLYTFSTADLKPPVLRPGATDAFKIPSLFEGRRISLEEQKATYLEADKVPKGWLSHQEPVEGLPQIENTTEVGETEE